MHSYLNYFVVVLTTFVCAPSAFALNKPNILFIAIDDLNDWVGPLGGHPQAKTPHLDRLAKMGMTFTNAHIASPACHPSRLAIMTGVRPSTSGVVNNEGDRTPHWRNRPHFKNALTIPQHLRNHGYRVVGGGKIFHTLQWWTGDKNDPASWDDYFPSVAQPIPTWARPDPALRQDGGDIGPRPLVDDLFGWAPLAESTEQTSDHYVADWAITEMRRKHERPFFIAAGLFRPHIPWEVPGEWFEMYPLDEIQLPAHREDDLVDAWDHTRRGWHQWVVANNQWKRAVQGYLASISYVDHQVGRILDGLAASEYADNTIIVLWSDHGMHIGEKENWEKFTLWNESTRVPLFVVAPGVTTPGSRCDRAVSTLDIYKTLAELTATTPVADHVEGESLLPLLKDPAADRKQPAVTTYLTHHSLRSDGWRYIHYSHGLRELYDQAADPGEHTNLAYDPAHQATLNALHRQLEEAIGRKLSVQSLPAGYVVVNGRLAQDRYVTMTEAVIRAKAAYKTGRPVPYFHPDGRFGE